MSKLLNCSFCMRDWIGKEREQKYNNV